MPLFQQKVTEIKKIYKMSHHLDYLLYSYYSLNDICTQILSPFFMDLVFSTFFRSVFGDIILYFFLSERETTTLTIAGG